MFGLRFAEENAMLRIENDGLNAKLAEANRIKGLQAQDIEVLRREADEGREAKAAKAALEAELEETRALLAEAREANGQQAQDIVALFKEQAEYQKSVDMLTKDLDAAKAGWTKANKEALRLSNENEELRKLLSMQSADLKENQECIDRLREIGADWQEQAENQRERHKEVIKERDAALRTVEEMKAKFADRREKHTLEVNALVAERNTAQAEAAELHEKLHTLEEKYRHLDATLGKVQTERDIAENNVVVLERRLKEVTAERDSAIEAHSGICAHLEQREAKLEELRKAFEAVKAERDQAREAMEGAVKDTTYWRHCYEKAQAQYKGLLPVCDELKNALDKATASRDYQSLIGERDAACKAVADWQRRFETANDLTEGWHQEACELRGQLTEKDAEIAALTGELVQLQADYKELDDQYRKVNSAYDELEDRVKKVQANAVAPMQPAEVTHGEDLHHATDPVDVASKLYTMLTGYATQALACQPIDVERLQAVNEAKWLVVELLNRLTKPL